MKTSYAFMHFRKFSDQKLYEIRPTYSAQIVVRRSAVDFLRRDAYEGRLDAMTVSAVRHAAS